jgi:hypothetical protein
MTIYYADISTSNDGTHAGTIGDPFSYDDLQTHSMLTPWGDRDEYRIKGSRSVDIKDGFYCRLWSEEISDWVYETLEDTWFALLGINFWTSYPDGDPWRIHVYNSDHDSDPDYRIDISICPDLPKGFECGWMANGIISVPKGEMRCSYHFVNMTIECVSNTLYPGANGLLGSTFNCKTVANGGVTAGFTDCIVIGDVETTYDTDLNNISFNNCVLTEDAYDPLQVTSYQSQWDWSNPTWPAWNAALAQYGSNVLSATVQTPPQPGTPPYETGGPYEPYPQYYAYGYLNTPRIGIGAVLFQTKPLQRIININ